MSEKKGLLSEIIYRNKIQLICEAFTFATILDIIISLISNGSTSHEHLLSRLIIVALSVLSLEVFKVKKLSMTIVFLLHFLVCVGIMLISTWFNGLFLELHPNAYWDGIRSVFIVYPIFVIGIVIGNMLSKKRK